MLSEKDRRIRARMLQERGMTPRYLPGRCKVRAAHWRDMANDPNTSPQQAAHYRNRADRLERIAAAESADAGSNGNP